MYYELRQVWCDVKVHSRARAPAKTSGAGFRSHSRQAPAGILQILQIGHAQPAAVPTSLERHTTDKGYTLQVLTTSGSPLRTSRVAARIRPPKHQKSISINVLGGHVPTLHHGRSHLPTPARAGAMVGEVVADSAAEVHQELLHCRTLIEHLGRGVVYFGSARIMDDHPFWDKAKELAKQVSEGYVQ